MSFDDGNHLVLTEVFIRIDTTHAYPHVLRAMRAWQPDAVLYDVSEFAAPLAAETLGIPAVCVGITVSGEMDLFFAPPMVAALDSVRARFGLRRDPDVRRLLVDRSYRAAAQRIADAAERLPTVDLAPEIVYDLVDDALVA